MPKSPLQNCLNWVYKKFSKNTATMLVLTGTAGWALSSIAQIGAIYMNKKITKEQRDFLVPQEIGDALINILSFFAITQVTKKVVSKMASTGKIAPKSVREFLNINKDKYGDKVGKLALDLDEVLKTESKFPKDAYYAYKNIMTTGATIGASVLASNIITPIGRNYYASKAQNYYKNQPQNYSGNMKI